MSSFIFFGCWNNVECDEDDKKEYIIRDLVLKLVKKYNKYSKKVIYLAGDNWYSNKVKTDSEETKSEDLAYYLLEVLKSGYDKIYDLKAEVHICAGNHDVKDDGEEPRNLKDKCMIKTQKKYIKELNDLYEIVSSKSQLPESFVADTSKSSDFDISVEDLSKLALTTSSSSSRELVENFHPSLEDLMTYDGRDILPTENNIINMYVDNVGIVKKEDSYVMIIINTNRLDDKTYVDSVIKILNENYETKKKFVMGHIPFYYLKNNQIKKNKEILETLFKSIAANKFIYLCADAHQFSIMTISLGDEKLIQITMGTGGASPDINDETEDIKEKSSNGIGSFNTIDGYTINYSIDENTTINYYLVNAYGYGIVYLYDNYIKVIYKNIKSKQEDDTHYPVLTEYVCKIGTSTETKDDSIYKFGNIISIVKGKTKKITDYATLTKNKKTLCDKIKAAIKEIEKQNDNKHVVKSIEKKDVYCFVKRKKPNKKSGKMSAASSSVA